MRSGVPNRGLTFAKAARQQSVSAHREEHPALTEHQNHHDRRQSDQSPERYHGGENRVTHRVESLPRSFDLDVGVLHHPCHHERHCDVEHRADPQRRENTDGHVPLRLLGLLGGGRDDVKTYVSEEHQRRTGKNPTDPECAGRKTDVLQQRRGGLRARGGSRAASGAEATPSLLQDLGFAPGAFGISGIFAGAALVFFAYIGFDIVATAAEETKKPQRDMPIGIFASLGICTVLYVAVSLVVTGMVKYTDIKVEAPLAEAFRSVGRPVFATVISIGALVGLTTVMMILMLGQSRVFFAISRDRLLPAAFAKVSPRFGTPLRTTVLTGVVVAVIATFVPLTELAELVNIGTLFAFVLVAVGVLVLRRTRPDLKRAFRCPGVPVVPVLAMLTSVYLMLNLPSATWIRFFVWMAIGLVVYFAYGARRSRLATDPNYSRDADTAAAEKRQPDPQK